MKYYLNPFKNYAVINGRASRKEYLYFLLINTVIAYAILLLPKEFDVSFNVSKIFAITGLIYICIIMCPTICLEIRRLHDVGKSGVWWWIRLVPILNIYFLYLTFLKDGQPFTNEYGPSPITNENKLKSKQSHNNKKQKRKKR